MPPVPSGLRRRIENLVKARTAPATVSGETAHKVKTGHWDLRENPEKAVRRIDETRVRRTVCIMKSAGSGICLPVGQMRRFLSFSQHAPGRRGLPAVFFCCGKIYLKSPVRTIPGPVRVQYTETGDCFRIGHSAGKEGKMKSERTWKKFRALLLAALLVIGMMPVSVFAADTAADHPGQVHVVVENTAYQSADASQNGILADKWVSIGEDSTMKSILTEAVGEDNINIISSAYGDYISGIFGLESGTGGKYAGWMCMINDWFTDQGIGSYSVSDGTIEAGDEITVVYSLTGSDMGGTYSNNDKTVRDVRFSSGVLNQTFDKDTHSYTLTVIQGVSSILVTPTASNKNFQVRTTVNGKTYKRTEMVPVSDGTVISVVCGDPSWPSMNNYGGASSVQAESYTFTVQIAVPMYRLYNPNSGEHFYTASVSEKNNVVKAGWKYEGIGWYAPKKSGVPVYRLYNPNAGDHHYTTSRKESDNLVKAGWKYEGIRWYSSSTKEVPLYRVYNPNAKAGAHHFTVQKKEVSNLVKAGWRAEGIGWYGLKVS